MSAGFQALAEAVLAYQRRKAVGVFNLPMASVHSGAVVVSHRASADLSTNYHYHGIFPDGVFTELEPGGPLTFLRLPAPTRAEVAGVALDAGRRLCRYLERRGFWETTTVSPDTIDGTLKLPKRNPCAARFFGQSARDQEGGTAARDGAYPFHIYVGNAIDPLERPQLEYLVHYIFGSPFYDHQVSRTDDGMVIFRFKRPRHDGTTEVVLTPFGFLDR